EERSKGKFKGKRLIFTPENIEKEEKTDDKKASTEETITGKTIAGFLQTSEDSIY
ncbi:hypothetical protein I6E43_16025, partial [Fusobacterium varium]|nr:hypothetical protein [Fusobacterium varium]